MGVAKTAHTVDSVPFAVAYTYGQSFRNILVFPIPRFLWSEKPDVRPGREFASDVLNGRGTSGVPPGFIAELYWNGGYILMIPVMFVLGVFYHRFDRSLENDDGSLFGKLLLVVVVVNFSFKLFGSDLAGAFISTLTMGIPIYICARYAGARR